jgi:hypothetical protein
MRRFITAAALSLGLFSAGGTLVSATARPYRDAAPAQVTDGITPVHDLRHPHRRAGPHFVPPRSHWHGYAPAPRHRYSRDHRGPVLPYGWQQFGWRR